MPHQHEMTSKSVRKVKTGHGRRGELSFHGTLPTFEGHKESWRTIFSRNSLHAEQNVHLLQIHSSKCMEKSSERFLSQASRLIALPSTFYACQTDLLHRVFGLQVSRGSLLLDLLCTNLSFDFCRMRITLTLCRYCLWHWQRC